MVGVRLSFVFIGSGMLLLAGLLALARQDSKTQGSVESGSEAAGALDILQIVSINGTDALTLILPLGLAAAFVIGVIAVTLGTQGGVGR